VIRVEPAHLVLEVLKEILVPKVPQDLKEMLVIMVLLVLQVRRVIPEHREGLVHKESRGILVLVVPKVHRD
jgi:hypothetical protein|tara:strand:- start:287 stop:499 length:213 start_codon:yes stop_codon:yes gene_type:complete